MAFSLTWLAEVLLDAGLKVAEVPEWRARGLKDMGDIRGVICHHTAGPVTGNMPSLNLIKTGRPDLQGPLAQLGLGRDGTFYVIAAGFCQHAGKGEWHGQTSGNTNFIGIEAENTGLPNDTPWPSIQMEAYARGIAAIFRHLDLPVGMCCGHKEWAVPHGRKSDPSFDMEAFRSQIQGFMSGTTPVPPPVPAVDADARPTLRNGSRGDAVKQLQAALKIGVDGLFGGGTEAKVRAFQREHDMVPDGIVGPKTWLVLFAPAGP
ncbi:N-acetylmuramoyl-L-alanine amidase [Sphingosinicellaceae bacterium]|nr:N-acetylmuramoyl-L-alanine amidase [Sphingosinicellaceae bacterium]